jgi:flagellar biosynthesis chaperone FliJ
VAFKFSLATVLRAREITEKQEERKLQLILGEISNAIKALAHSEETLRACSTLREAHINVTLSANNIQTLFAEVALSQSNRDNLLAHLSRLELSMKNQFDLYLAARHNREMLTEMYRDRKVVYEIDQTKREQSALDDNYAARRSRDRHES